MPRSRLGLKNESIFTSKFNFVLATKSTQQKTKNKINSLKIICFETDLSYCNLTTDLVLMRLGRHYV